MYQGTVVGDPRYRRILRGIRVWKTFLAKEVVQSQTGGVDETEVSVILPVPCPNQHFICPKQLSFPNMFRSLVVNSCPVAHSKEHLAQHSLQMDMGKINRLTKLFTCSSLNGVSPIPPKTVLQVIQKEPSWNHGRMVWHLSTLGLSCSAAWNQWDLCETHFYLFPANDVSFSMAIDQWFSRARIGSATQCHNACRTMTQQTLTCIN